MVRVERNSVGDFGKMEKTTLFLSVPALPWKMDIDL